MRRRLLNLLTAPSLLLGVAVVALWVPSFRRHDYVWRNTTRREAGSILRRMGTPDAGLQGVDCCGQHLVKALPAEKGTR